MQQTKGSSKALVSSPDACYEEGTGRGKREAHLEVVRNPSRKRTPSKPNTDSRNRTPDEHVIKHNIKWCHDENYDGRDVEFVLGLEVLFGEAIDRVAWETD